MVVIKRDGREAEFDKGKIANAILKAFTEVEKLSAVIIPPCKVGDTVWVITGTAIKLCTVDRIHILGNGQVQIRAKYFVTDNIYLYPDMFGKTVFLTCAEAEAAIEARKGGKE